MANYFFEIKSANLSISVEPFMSNGYLVKNIELYEELGLNLEIYPNEAIDHFCTIDDPSRDVRENIVSRYLIHVDYIATRKKLADKEINCDTVSRGGEPNEVDDIKFVPAEDIDSYDWAFNHDQVLKEILEYLETGRKPKYCEE